MIGISTLVLILAIYFTSSVNTQREIGEANFYINCDTKVFVAEHPFFAPTPSSLDSDCFNIPNTANNGTFTAVEPHSLSNACLDSCSSK